MLSIINTKELGTSTVLFLIYVYKLVLLPNAVRYSAYSGIQKMALVHFFHKLGIFLCIVAFWSKLPIRTKSLMWLFSAAKYDRLSY